MNETVRNVVFGFSCLFIIGGIIGAGLSAAELTDMYDLGLNDDQAEKALLASLLLISGGVHGISAVTR